VGPTTKKDGIIASSKKLTGKIPGKKNSISISENKLDKNLINTGENGNSEESSDENPEAADRAVLPTPKVVRTDEIVKFLFK
jgi:hypothetical protein